jgi:hypothetical protein
MKLSKLYLLALVIIAGLAIVGCGQITRTDASSGNGGTPGGLVDSSTLSKSAVNLRSAGDFVILSKAGITTTGTTAITGNIGVSPISHTAIVGFGLIGVPANDPFLTSALVNGKIYAANLFPPTPAKMTAAIGDMMIAYADAAARIKPTATELYAGDLSGQTIPPGVYKWSSGVLINAPGLTLAGPADGVWIFQISQSLTVGNGAIVSLTGGAVAQNVFWQTPGAVSIGTTAQFKGTILSATTIALHTGARLDGRAYSQTNVTLDSNPIVQQ